MTTWKWGLIVLSTNIVLSWRRSFVWNCIFQTGICTQFLHSEGPTDVIMMTTRFLLQLCCFGDKYVDPESFEDPLDSTFFRILELITNCICRLGLCHPSIYLLKWIWNEDRGAQRWRYIARKRLRRSSSNVVERSKRKAKHSNHQ